jgi:pimeloyl-ACP methyl ester carboxylesterase
MSSLPKRYLKRGLGTSAGLGVVLVLAVSLAVSALAASESTRTHSSTTGNDRKPTVVLVHGGWDNSTGWNAVIAKLQARGFDVIAPPNPLRQLASDSAYLSSVLDTIKGPIVLVGHSYGGAVITNAAVGHKNVKALVYIAGFAPDEGESLVQLVTMNPGSEIGPSTLIARPYPLPDGGEGTDLYLTRRGFRTAFAADVPRHTTDLMFATQRPFSQEAFDSRSGEPAWESIPSWYLITTQDRAIPPATQRFMAERAGAKTAEVAASHVPQISRPGAVIRIILQAAESLD